MQFETSLTIFKNEYGQEVARMFRKDDGYIEGHGRELANFLKGISIGLSRKNESGRWNPSSKKGAVENMECLAAQVVAHFTTGREGIYLLPDKLVGNDELSWPVRAFYTIRPKREWWPDTPIIEVDSLHSPDPVFTGTGEEMLTWIELIEEGCFAEDRAVVRVNTPYQAIDFDDRYPYLRSVEYDLGSKKRHGAQMSKSMQEEFFNMKLHGPSKGDTIIACIGSRDDLAKRIKQAHLLGETPSKHNNIETLILWAANGDDSIWPIWLEHRKKCIVPCLPRAILKVVGKDPTDSSGKVLEWRRDMLDAFITKSQRKGYKVTL